MPAFFTAFVVVPMIVTFMVAVIVMMRPDVQLVIARAQLVGAGPLEGVFGFKELRIDIDGAIRG